MFEQKQTTDWKVIYISITITINNISSNHHHARKIDQLGHVLRGYISVFLVVFGSAFFCGFNRAHSAEEYQIWPDKYQIWLGKYQTDRRKS